MSFELNVCVSRTDLFDPYTLSLSRRERGLP